MHTNKNLISTNLKLMLTLFLVFFQQMVMGQLPQKIIKGVVLDNISLAPLEGVQIQAMNSHTFSESQTDGIYAIPISTKDSILVFRFDDYESIEYKIGKDYTVDIKLIKKGSLPKEIDLSKLEGQWRAIIKIRPDLDVPIQFNIRKNGKDWTVDLINGEEHFPTGNIQVKEDSLFIPFPLFDNELALTIKENNLEGQFRHQDLKGFSFPFKAEKGVHYRFIENGSNAIKDISGNYQVSFKSSTGKEEQAVGVFKQKGNHLSATFLRITGDARYLDGLIEDNQILLSSFIGSSPALYVASIGPDGIIKGENLNTRGSTAFVAEPKASASLPDAYSLTKLNEGKNQIHFKFPDANNQLISNDDQKFKGKALIISIGGTWCPNCMDEANFLGPWYEKNKNRGIEIIGLQYERQTDQAFVKKAFDKFKKQFGIQYTLLLGGTADKQVVLGSIPELQNFLSFPTTIFIGKDGIVKKIHTGFSGPATGEHYAAFIKEFNEEVDQLLAAH